MRARCITVDTQHSRERYARLVQSHAEHGCRVTLDRVDGVTPDDVERLMRQERLTWTYPWDEVQVQHGMRLHPYVTRDRAARMACFMSHFMEWRRCADDGESVLIMEDDAVFVRRFHGLEGFYGFGAVSVNDPRGATRRATVYHDMVQGVAGPAKVVPAPWVDTRDVPQGLPGHSAYAIQPWLARELISLALDVGAWPNDALMCKQLCQSALGCLREYATRVQLSPSGLA